MFCIQLIGLLIPMDKELHIRALKVIVHSLIHESSEIRKVSKTKFMYVLLIYLICPLSPLW